MAQIETELIVGRTLLTQERVGTDTIGITAVGLERHFLEEHLLHPWRARGARPTGVELHPVIRLDREPHARIETVLAAGHVDIATADIQALADD
ncbi:hypothetical protein D3C77_354320 [compost metagenome]